MAASQWLLPLEYTVGPDGLFGGCVLMVAQTHCAGGTKVVHLHLAFHVFGRNDLVVFDLVVYLLQCCRNGAQNPSLLQKDQGFKSLERLHDSLLGVLAIVTVLLTDPCIPTDAFHASVGMRKGIGRTRAMAVRLC